MFGLFDQVWGNFRGSKCPCFSGLIVMSGGMERVVVVMAVGAQPIADSSTFFMNGLLLLFLTNSTLYW